MTKCGFSWYDRNGWLGIKHQVTYLPYISRGSFVRVLLHIYILHVLHITINIITVNVTWFDEVPLDPVLLIRYKADMCLPFELSFDSVCPDKTVMIDWS